VALSGRAPRQGNADTGACPGQSVLSAGVGAIDLPLVELVPRDALAALHSDRASTWRASPGAMVPTVVPGEHAPDPTSDPRLNVDRDRLHLIVTPTELDIIVDALRSVGNVELAERFEAVLHQLGQGSSRERHA
jgi:hypothetical protein